MDKSSNLKTPGNVSKESFQYFGSIDVISMGGMKTHLSSGDIYVDGRSECTDTSEALSNPCDSNYDLLVSDSNSIQFNSLARTIRKISLVKTFPYNCDFPMWREDQRRLLASSFYPLSIDAGGSIDKASLMQNLTEILSVMINEAKWRNEIAADAHLSQILSEVDDVYASNISADLLDSSSTSEQTLTESTFTEEPTPTKVENGVFYLSASERNPTTMRSETDGIDNVIIKHDFEVMPDCFVQQVLEAFLHKAEINDESLRKWIDDILRNPDKLYSADSLENSCSQLMSQIRDEWIFKLHPQKNTKDILDDQNWRCAGCGVRIQEINWKRTRYCDYYGAYFCACCHRGAKSLIPARVLHLWSFTKMPVCDRAFLFLEQTFKQPVLHLNSIAPKLIEKNKLLKYMVTLRQKIVHIWHFIEQCNSASLVVTKEGVLRELFASIPPHMLTYEYDLFSIADLEKTNSKELQKMLEPVVQLGRSHVENCDFCRNLAFHCDLCNDREYLFPFQLEKVTQCSNCGSLAHIKCEAKRCKQNLPCPKCERLKTYSDRRRIISVSDDS